MKSFKKFWRDYWDLCINSLVFLKKHWLGMIIFSVVYVIVYLLIFFPSVFEILWETITEKFSRKEVVEEDEDF